jgi:hypothetical protein
MKLTAHLHLVPRLRMSGAIPVLPLYAFMVWTGKTLPSLYVFLLHVIWLTVIHIKMFLCLSVVGWDGVVSVATCCGLVSLGIESWWGSDFLYLSRLALAPPAPFTVGTRSLSPGVKQPGRSIDHPPLSSAKVKERVELHLFSSSGPSWPGLSLT